MIDRKKYLLPWERWNNSNYLIVRYYLYSDWDYGNYILYEEDRKEWKARGIGIGYYRYFSSLEKAKEMLDKMLIDNEYVLIPEDKVEIHRLLL